VKPSLNPERGHAGGAGLPGGGASGAAAPAAAVGDARGATPPAAAAPPAAPAGANLYFFVLTARSLCWQVSRSCAPTCCSCTACCTSRWDLLRQQMAFFCKSVLLLQSLFQRVIPSCTACCTGRCTFDALIFALVPIASCHSAVRLASPPAPPVHWPGIQTQPAVLAGMTFCRLGIVCCLCEEAAVCAFGNMLLASHHNPVLLFRVPSGQVRGLKDTLGFNLAAMRHLARTHKSATAVMGEEEADAARPVKRRREAAEEE